MAIRGEDVPNGTHPPPPASPHRSAAGALLAWVDAAIEEEGGLEDPAAVRKRVAALVAGM